MAGKPTYSDRAALQFSRSHLLGWVISILLLVSVSAPAALQFDVFLGYDGTVREASWFPVVCEIKNDGPSFVGVIEVFPSDNNKGQVQRMTVELPTGTLKRVVVPVFAAGRYATRWDVRLLNERGRMQAEQTSLQLRRQVGWSVPLVGSLSRTASGAVVLQQAKRDQPDLQPAAVRFQALIFPDNPIVLEGLDALYLSSEVAAQLRNSQVQALISWVNAGGHLIVGVEQVSDVTASAWLQNLLPCEPKEIRVLRSHRQLQDWLQSGGWPEGARRKKLDPDSTPVISEDKSGAVITGNVQVDQTEASVVSATRPFGTLPPDPQFELADLPVMVGNIRDGRVVLAVDDVPVIINATRGRGVVTALMFSPEREPLKSWKNLPVFWARLTEVPGSTYVTSDYSQSYGQSTDGIFGGMIDSRQVHKLPIGWLLLLLLVYLLVIGPLDQWWLKRIGKPMLTWITFPCYVVMFSLIIYLIGYKLRAGEAEFNELHVVDVLQNNLRAELRGRTYASIYSPSNERYPLASRLKFATLRGEFIGMSGGQGTEKADLMLSGDNFKADVFVPVWTSQLYISDWWHSTSLPLAVNVVRQSESWIVTIENKTDRPVSAAQLVVAGRVISLGEFPAGQTRTLTVQNDSGSSVSDFVQRHGQNFQSVVQQRQFAFGQSEHSQISDLANASMAASLVTQLSLKQDYMEFIAPPGLDLSEEIARGQAVILAWMENYAPVPPLNQFKPKRGFRHTLLRMPVTVSSGK